jgi:hypothetical protein
MDGFDVDVSRHAAAERYLHSMHIHEQWTAKCASACRGQDIADVDPELIEIPSHAVSARNADDAAGFTELQLSQRDHSQMITILICNSRGHGREHGRR